MTRRKPITRVVARKYGYAVIRYGHVQFRHQDIAAIDTFLSTFDPELAERRSRAKSGRAEAFLKQLLAECEA